MTIGIKSEAATITKRQRPNSQQASYPMIDQIRNNKALTVVKPSNETTVAKHPSGRQHPHKDEATLKFLEKRHPKSVLPGEKGSLVDIYA